MISKTLLLFLFIVTFIQAQCPPGNVMLSSQADVDNFIATYPNCDTINGELFITGSVTDLSGLDYIQIIDDALIIRDSQLTSISNFNKLYVVYNTIDISDNLLLESINGFDNLTHLSMLFYISNNPNLQFIDGFNNASDVFFDFWISNNPSLQSISGFNNLQSVEQFMAFNDCPQLTSIPSFNSLTNIGWSVQFYNTGLIDISGFESITLIGGFDSTSGFVISNNQRLLSISGFCSLQRIEYDLLIQENPVLVDLSGLSSLESVGQFFTIRNNDSLASLNGFQSLIEISRSGNEGTETLSIHDNPMLIDCDPLCNALTSNMIFGIVNFNNNSTGCNSEAEVNTSNCIPFEVLECTTLAGPFDGDVDIAVDTNITWQPITGATYYLISVGITPDGSEIINRLNVGNVTEYNLPEDLPFNSEIFVKVIPYSDTGNATCCTEETFKTENSSTLPDCTNLTSPLNGSSNVAINTDLMWNSVANATGYILSVGTTSGETDIVNTLDVGDTTTYNLPADLPDNTVIYVTITPYNVDGNAIECIEEIFTTESISTVPVCTNLTMPLDGETNVSVTTDLMWNSVTNATGYILTVGTTSGGTDIVNTLDVGDITTYNLPADLPDNTVIYVTITPYNVDGNAIECIEEIFTTEAFVYYRIPKYFTPNNDGYNDFWLVEDLLNQIVTIQIFDRYGKLIKTLTSNSVGWDGTFNNQPLPVNDYWYVINFYTGKSLKGHFSLKR